MACFSSMSSSMVTSCHSSAKRFCKANIWSRDKVASHFLCSPTLERKPIINQSCHSESDGQVIATKWDLAKRQTKFCMAPHAEGSIMYVCAQAAYFPTTGIVLGCFMASWLSTIMQNSNGSADARVVGAREWSQCFKHLESKCLTEKYLLGEHSMHAVYSTRLTWPESIQISLMKICKKDVIRLVFLKGRAPFELVKGAVITFKWTEQMVSSSGLKIILVFFWSLQLLHI